MTEFEFDSVLSTLNDLQREATQFHHKQLLQIKAPPGSGKTRIVISRLMYLVLACNIPSNKIVVTTFGKKAANEIKERIIDLVPTDKRYLFMDLNVGTFHSLCLKLLMKHGYRLGYHNPTIITESEQKLILQNAIAALPDHLYDYYINHENIVQVAKWDKSDKKSSNNDNKHVLDFDISSILKYISKLKSQGLVAEKYKQTSGRNLDQGILYFYEAYERDALEMQKVDFDDLLLHGYRLLKNHEETLPSYDHILVDEFQDTSALQLQIVLLWAKRAHSGITVVGDPDQCIYAFRDASPSNFKDMRHLCDNPVTVIPLNQNYRSSQKIIDCCQHIIKSDFNDLSNTNESTDDSNINEMFESALCGQFDTDFGPVYREFASFDQEAMHISNEIKYLTSLPGDVMKFSEIAVLVRTNRQITTIEKHLITNYIPYRIIGSKGFLNYPEIVLFMNCLRLVVNFKNREKSLFSNKKTWILEILNEIENNGIGEVSLLNIHKYFASKKSSDPIDLLLEVSEHEKIITNNKGKDYIKLFIKNFLVPCSDFAAALDGTEEGLSRFFSFVYTRSGLERCYNDTASKSEDEKSDNDKKKDELRKSKHNRIMTLKEMFLGFKPLKTQQNNYTLPFIHEFIESIDMFPVEENGIDPGADEKKSNASDINDENNRVTICTVHKSKGLEWSTVFVPGCSEKIIPCLITNDDSNNTGEKLTEENVSFENYKQPSASTNQMIQEEKRVFYVALSRAKHLLYITAIDNEEKKQDDNRTSSKRTMIRSRFLKQELVDRLNAYSSVFSSVKSVKQLYEIKSLNFKSCFDSIKDDFSLKIFLRDYETYIEEKSWQLYWMGRKVYNLNGLDTTKNISMVTSTMFSTGFVSAKQHVEQMDKDKSNKRVITLSKPISHDITAPTSPSKNYAPKTKYVKKKRGLSIPTQAALSKNTDVLLSPTKKPEYAPRQDSEISRSPTRKPMRAPNSPTKQRTLKNNNGMDNMDVSPLNIDESEGNPYVNIAIKTERKDDEIGTAQQRKKGSQKTIDQMFKLQRGKKRKRLDLSIETITLSD